MMNADVKKFIKENLNLIQQNTGKSWEEIYKIIPAAITGEFTEILLVANIDPAKILGYIPNHYLYESNISAYTMPSHVKSIGYEAFEHCTNLTSIIIPNSVTSIDSYAFNGCTSLTNITIPESVTSINRFVFN